MKDGGQDSSKNGAKLAHEEIWGKSPETVVYGEYCPLCDTRIDEFGLCGCGAGGG